jgi:hypothetical protein
MKRHTAHQSPLVGRCDSGSEQGEKRGCQGHRQMDLKPKEGEHPRISQVTTIRFGGKDFCVA